ncbi:MAG: helix-turn-helix domain-containing protein [Clostridia bacterium]|nr:helix-turn-helix domain-containing protein [Clostridia bacterium]
MSIGANIRQARRRAGLTLEELAGHVGLSRQTLSRYENGVISNIPHRTLEAMAEKLGVAPEVLMGWAEPPQSFNPNVSQSGNLVTFRILAGVSAGYEGFAYEYDGDERETLPLAMIRGFPASECCLLRVSGNSMAPRICDGDRVLVHLQSSVDSGEVAVMIYEGEKSTIKTVRYVNGEDWLELIPANPEYEPRRIEGAELERCKVFGKVIKLIRDV